jgi:hypothetical protein
VYPDGKTFRVQGQPTPFWNVQGKYSISIRGQQGQQVIKISVVAGGESTYGKSTSCSMYEADLHPAIFAKSVSAVKSFNSNSDLWVTYINGKCTNIVLH